MGQRKQAISWLGRQKTTVFSLFGGMGFRSAVGTVWFSERPPLSPAGFENRQEGTWSAGSRELVVPLLVPILRAAEDTIVSRSRFGALDVSVPSSFPNPSRVSEKLHHRGWRRPVLAFSR